MTLAVRYCNGNSDVSYEFYKLNIKSAADFCVINKMHFFGYLLPCGPRHSFTRFLVWVGESDLQGHQAWWVCMVTFCTCMMGMQLTFLKTTPAKQPNIDIRKQYLFGKHPHIGGSRNKILMTVESIGILQ